MRLGIGSLGILPASLLLGIFVPLQGTFADALWEDFTPEPQRSQLISCKQNKPAPVVTSVPYVGTKLAPGNLALNGMHRTTLPPTRLTSFVLDSGKRDDIYGMEGRVDNTIYAPISSGFSQETSEGLTTGHTMVEPGLWSFH